MQYKVLALLLTVGLLLSAAGCKNTDHSSAASISQEPQTFGAENLTATPQPMHETVHQTDSNIPESEVPASSAEPSQNAPKLDEQAILSALISEQQDGFTYNCNDPVYFWRAVAYLVAYSGETIEDGQIRISAQDIMPYVTALFGPYTEQLPTPGEENPLVSEEYADGQSIYIVTSTGPSDYTMERTDPEPQADGTYVSRVTLSGPSGSANYTVTLTDYPSDAGGSNQFSYCITDIFEG